jgi:hypothetical protein
MKKILCLFLMLISAASFAKTGHLFTVTVDANRTQLTVTPTANHYYPGMGIKITSVGHTASDCFPYSNGFCLFAASNTSPKVLPLAGPFNTAITGRICLDGAARYSCQKFTVQKPPAVKAYRVFVSSSSHQGDLTPSAGGIAGGNSICQNLATAAGLSGNWRAWLSTSMVNAVDNIQYNANNRYVRAVSGVEIADQGVLVMTNITQLTNSIQDDEFGNSAGGAPAWTGTGADGTAVANHCTGWTNNSAADSAWDGNSSSKITDWTIMNFELCSSLNRIYCFEVPTA